MEKKIAVNQLEIYRYIDELKEKIDSDNLFKQTVFGEINKTIGTGQKRNTEKEKDYQIITALVNKEFKGEVVSNTTVWRLLKIKDCSKEIYNKILNNEISIKAAYNTAFPSKKEKQESIPTNVVVTYDYDKNDCPDFEKILNMVTDLNIQLENWKGKLPEDPSITELKQLDTEIFKFRKNVGWIIARLQETDSYV